MHHWHSMSFASASGEVSQLQTPFPPADPAGLISLSFPKGSHWNACQTPCSEGSWAKCCPACSSCSKCDIQPCTKTPESQSALIKVHRDPSLHTFDYPTFIMVNAAIFLMLTKIKHCSILFFNICFHSGGKKSCKKLQAKLRTDPFSWCKSRYFHRLLVDLCQLPSEDSTLKITSHVFCTSSIFLINYPTGFHLIKT